MGVAVSLLLVGFLVLYRLVKTEIARQTNQPLCLNRPKPATQCYIAETVLSRQLTTAMVGQPNGRLLVSSDRTSIHLWDVGTNERIQTLKGHSSGITALAISGNGSLLASADFKGTIKLWQLPSGQLQRTFNAGSVTALAFNQTGTVLASGSRLVQQQTDAKRVSAFVPHPIQLWDVMTHHRIARINASEPVNTLALSPDAQWLAAGATSTKVWHIPSRKLVHRLDSGDLNTLMFNPDSTLLLTGSDGTRGQNGIKMWQVRSGQLVQKIDSVASDFALSQDGSLLITTYGGAAHLWRMESSTTFNHLGTLYGSEYSGLFAEFGLNGNAIALAGSDGVKVWFAKPK